MLSNQVNQPSSSCNRNDARPSQDSAASSPSAKVLLPIANQVGACKQRRISKLTLKLTKPAPVPVLSTEKDIAGPSDAACQANSVCNPEEKENNHNKGAARGAARTQPQANVSSK